MTFDTRNAFEEFRQRLLPHADLSAGLLHDVAAAERDAMVHPA